MNGHAAESPWASETVWSSELGNNNEVRRTHEEAPAPAALAGYELRSPFLSSASFAESLSVEAPLGLAPASMTSPFVSSYVPVAQQDARADAMRQLLRELEDESFEEALERLVDEAAGQYLASEASWSSSETAPALASGELERWVDPLATEMDHLLDEMANRLSAEDFESLRQSELDTLLESLRPQPLGLPEAFEQFLGGFFNKVTKVVKGTWDVAKKGVQAVGRVLPVGWLLDKLRAIARPWLERVLQKARGHLPAAVQPMADMLAARLLGTTAPATQPAAPADQTAALPPNPRHPRSSPDLLASWTCTWQTLCWRRVRVTLRTSLRRRRRRLLKRRASR
jgi:hypothetical protein